MAVGRVLAIGILPGILLAVFLGLLGLLIGAKRSASSVLGKLPGETPYRSLENYPNGETYPGLLMVRFDGSLFFANALDFADEIREGVAAFEPKVVLVDAESITHIDATATIAIADLSNKLTRSGVELRFARVRETVIDVIRRSEEGKALDPESFYISVQAGVDAYLSETAPSTES